MARLLVVEDDATMRSALSQSLRGAGYEVESAENGLRALEKVLAAPIDLIISDVRMPVMDGVSALSKVRQDFPNIKTVLITGYSDDEPIVRALNLGIDGILKKPFAMSDLLTMVSVKLREQEKEKIHQIREEKYCALLAKLTESVGDETAKTILGDEFPLLSRLQREESHRLSTLMELGRTAEIRGEFEAAIQAYEEGLQILAGSSHDKDEFPIRVALSDLFLQKNQSELAVFHAEEALSLGQRLKEGALIADAELNLAKIFLNLDPVQSLKHLKAVKSHLGEGKSKEKEAVFFLLSAYLALQNGERGKAKEAISDFLSFGRCSFLPQLVLAFQDISLPPLLLGLEEVENQENGFWLLEETAPYLQDRLRAILGQKPFLNEKLSRFLTAKSETKDRVLQVFALGKLMTTLEDEPLLESHWKSLKGRSLFLYLLHEYPKLVSEEHLLDVFWPHLDVEKGKHTFRTTLYFIRRTLGNKYSRNFMYSERQKFGIRPGSGFWCDFLDFREAYRRGRSDWEKGEKERAILALKEGEKLYKGAFLQGWSEEWVLNAREYFDEAFTWIMLTIASYLRQQKIWDEALTYAKKAMEIEPSLEEAHSFSIECFLAIGKRDEAVRQFHACREILKNELNVEPSPRTQDLYFKAIDVRPVG